MIHIQNTLPPTQAKIPPPNAEVVRIWALERHFLWDHFLNHLDKPSADRRSTWFIDNYEAYADGNFAETARIACNSEYSS